MAVVGVGLMLLLTVAGGNDRAFGDFAPQRTEVVGVGDVLSQYAFDFLADGDAYVDAGYNSAGNAYKSVSFDGTADANGRVAYGVMGNLPGNVVCSPGTGPKPGTGNLSSAYSTVGFAWSSPQVSCGLNPSVVLRSGSSPVQRPAGSTAGMAALEADVTAGNNGAGNEVVSFARSSVPVAASVLSSFGLQGVEVATDKMALLTAPTTNAVALSAVELNNIYTANISGVNAYGGQGCVTWNELPGNAAGSPDAIIPLLAPVGSDTRNAFLEQVQSTTGTSAAAGSCTVTVEENDLNAVVNQSQPVDAIEPMTGGWLDLMQGENVSGQNQGLGSYFLDPSCPYGLHVSACGSGTGSSFQPYYLTTGTGLHFVTGGTPGDGNRVFVAAVPIYVYFRSADLTSTTGWQRGTTRNWVETLLYNPCQSGQQCTTQGGITYGPGGPAFIATSEGQQLLSNAGLTPIPGA